MSSSLKSSFDITKLTFDIHTEVCLCFILFDYLMDIIIQRTKDILYICWYKHFADYVLQMNVEVDHVLAMNRQ